MPRKAKLYHYKLPLDCAMILRGQSVTEREGWLLELSRGAEIMPQCRGELFFGERGRAELSYGKVGRGEIAPLPGFSTETAAQAKQQLENVIKIWLDEGIVELNDCYPSVAFGFSMALLELEDGSPQNIHRSSNDNDASSALLLATDIGIITAKHKQLLKSRLCKLKIASLPTADGATSDGEVARHLLQTYPQLRLRLDANRRWSLAVALAFAARIPADYRQRIDFIEEPCHTPSDCLRFSEQTGIAIAWDESLRDAVRKKQGRGAFDLISLVNSPSNAIVKAVVIKAPVIKAIIIKPMLTGTVGYCAELIAYAHQQGLTAVISSSLESSFGLVQLAHMAQTLTPETPPGLDTVNVFTQQLVQPWPNCSLPLLPLSELPVTIYE
ncbi:o-succinylbenzoate synthase [Moritella sp. F3]|uniref:o-succinylbenzoate synthase n=1 Tax=Moritella sp. F3 TaxID=2718882 RepID=UPI0018E1B9DB|nr:o-succinylbenzoate synthase [Moritella sp. F3]GIC79405.1 o-succinylbenzoate synthase [Moritella sp. F1]GIC80341.1 o-succinylbenzoate synthase [Moritella sp. F3]